ncbi:MAG TPA: TetR/AcrR family transcriptional regulator [Aquabacterium sp.]|uniref:TetR/AcrR family transcriptional regulator n=1 Tax=Aquabacterium sp. TaxID=1872578 RepID=UPI002E301CB3|nr:TetR/AcrR family transcriptional regulator [Aquabacterium sp.]HEX5357375.1 TetR/AcrR family transcriptional regulator [Aquabacterium sp.]
MPKMGLPKETVGPRLEPDARRAHLLAVGASVFGSKAYDEVQIDQIAQQAGVSRGLLYHYFPSKRAFFAAIVQGGYDEILKATRPDPKLSPADQLQAGLEAYLDYVQSHPHMYRAIFRSAASLEQTVQEVVNRNLDLQARRILKSFGGSSTPHSLPYLAVRAWLAFLIQAVLDWLDHGARGKRQHLIDICVGALRGATVAAQQSANLKNADLG